MSLIASSMLALGTPARPFNLLDSAGKNWSLQDFDRSKFLLVMFICNHCPYVIHLKSVLVSFAKVYSEDTLSVVAINSNDAINYPADSPDQMKIDVDKYCYPFPYLIDDTQDVAKAYTAECTPDFFLYDSNRQLAYRGQFDASRPGNGVAITGSDLKNAIDSLASNRRVSTEQIPSVGCNIKWKI